MILDTEKILAKNVARLIHSERMQEAGAAVVDYYKIALKVADDPASYTPILQHFLHELLDHGGAEQAAGLLWKPNQFTYGPESVRMIWDLFETSGMGLIMGAASLGKSFSMGVRLMLEWVRDPEWTRVSVVGPSEAHLQENLFSHLVSLHNNATLPMPGRVGDLFIGLNRRNQLSCIRGVVIPKDDVKKAGRLQGGHRKPRQELHPIFGPLSRLFIFIDEIENVPAGVWKDVDNVIAGVETSNVGGFKIFGAYNPTNQTDEVGKRAEPVLGWQNLDENKDFRWKSIRGWDVLRLDGERCENVVAGKVVYPGLQTKDGLEVLARNAGGKSSPGYRTMGRGLYPETGVELFIIPAGMLPKWRGEFIWYDDPKPVGSADLALLGGANVIFTLGKFGLATGIKYPASIDFPNGRVEMFKDKMGQTTVRPGCQAETQFTVPKGDTVKVKDSLLKLCRDSGVRPKFFACDRTGVGAGVADLLRYEWSSEIHDVNYSQGASKEKMTLEDSKTCEELYERMATELWFGLRLWGEFQYFLIVPSMDMANLTQPITQRKFRSFGMKSKVEPKEDYKLRTRMESPDHADSLTLFVHAARKGSGVIISMRGDSIDSAGEDDDWSSHQYPGGTRIDITNRTDYLDESMDNVREIYDGMNLT